MRASVATARGAELFVAWLAVHDTAAPVEGEAATVKLHLLEVRAAALHPGLCARERDAESLRDLCVRQAIAFREHAGIARAL